MDINLLDYYKMLRVNNINIIYSGPIWGDGVEGISETLKKVMEFDKLSLTASKSIFAVFVEEMNNMLMYSAEKDQDGGEGHSGGLSRGIFVLGTHGKTYFLKSGNIVKNDRLDFLRSRMDYLNALDKDGLKKFYKEQIRSDNPNPESRGAGIGLTEIARRASAKIQYKFEPYQDGFSFFTMDVTVNSEGAAGRL